MKINMKKITDFKGFNYKEFCVNPRYWGLKWRPKYDAKEEFEQAKILAQDVDGICIAIVTDDQGQEYVLGESCSKGCSSKFVLFNAETRLPTYGEVRAITFNTGRGALSDYWYDVGIIYKKGSTC